VNVQAFDDNGGQVLVVVECAECRRFCRACHFVLWGGGACGCSIGVAAATVNRRRLECVAVELENGSVVVVAFAAALHRETLFALTTNGVLLL